MKEYTKEMVLIGLATLGVMAGYLIILGGVVAFVTWVVKMVWGA